MKQHNNSSRASGDRHEDNSSVRSGLLLTIVLPVVIGLAMIYAFVVPNSQQTPAETNNYSAFPIPARIDAPEMASPLAFDPLPDAPSSVAESTQEIDQLGASVETPGHSKQASAAAQQLMSKLVYNADLAQIATPEGAAEWRRALDQLIASGDDGVLAIRDFLNQNKDIDFGAAGLQSSGFPSARIAMFQALAQIGTPEALALLQQTLQYTAEPREVAILADNLNSFDPESYRADALAAARQALRLAADGQLSDSDVAPLFEVFQRYGDASVLQDLEQALGKWKYYAVTSLINLPDGIGVDAMVQLAQRTDGQAGASHNILLESLARVANQYPHAQEFIMQQARDDLIPANLWPYVAQALTGDQMHFVDSVYSAPDLAFSSGEVRSSHINYGNQNFYSVPGTDGYLPEQIQARVKVIDDLLGVVRDPAARPYLENTKNVLLGRLDKAAAAGALSGNP